jgi:hypothetical protein
VTVTYEPPARIDEITFRLAFRSDEPASAAAPVTLRIYVGGVWVGRIRSPDGYGEFDLQVGPGEEPIVEVLDRDCQIPAVAFPGRLDVHWRGDAAADHYRVEQFVSSVWTLQDTLPESGKGAYTWRSAWLEDETSHQFRVIAVDGNPGTAAEVSALMVRHPDAPRVAIAWNGPGTATFTVASA